MTCEGGSVIARRHFFLYPTQRYRPGFEAQFLHRGLLSFRVFDDASQTPYQIREGRLLHDDLDTGIVALPVEETKEHFFIREGKGGIASFDLNNGCDMGCRFCARLKNRATGDARRRWLDHRTERDAVEQLMDRHRLTDLRALDQISVVTGHFGGEELLLAHLHALLDAATSKGFRGDLYYAGAELATERHMVELRRRVSGRVYYAVTVDTFTRRARKMPGRGDTGYEAILRTSLSAFGRAHYNYILGMDTFADFVAGVESLAAYAVPYVSVFNVYLKSQEALYADGARDLGYYLAARDLLWRRFGRRVYMHDPPHYNVSNRALFSFPASVY